MAPRKPVKLKNLKQPVKPTMTNDSCPACGCGCCTTCCGCHLLGLFCSKSMWLMAIASIIAVFGFQMVWHGQVMMADYVATASLWRPFDQMDFTLIHAANILVGLFYAMLFRLIHRGGVIAGIKNGLLIAAPMAACAGLTAYATQPIPAHLAQMWAAGALLQGALVGLVLSLLSRCGSCK